MEVLSSRLLIVPKFPPLQKLVIWGQLVALFWPYRGRGGLMVSTPVLWGLDNIPPKESKWFSFARYDRKIGAVSNAVFVSLSTI